MSTTCDFRPNQNWAYDNWRCNLPTGHRGHHRFNNYTFPRVPHLHRGVIRVVTAYRRWVMRWLIQGADKWVTNPRTKLRLALHMRPRKCLTWDRSIWPTTYDPIP